MSEPFSRPDVRAPLSRHPLRLWRRRSAWLVLGSVAVAAVVMGLHPRRGIDLQVYLQAARRFVEASSLYREADGAMPFKYAPASAWLFVPWTWLPRPVAGAGWNLLTLGGFLYMVEWARRRANLETSRLETWALAVLVLLHPLMLEFHYGQVDALMGALLLWAHDAEERRRPELAGVAFVLAVLLKPPSALFGLVWLQRGALRPLLWAVPFALLAFLPVLLRYGGTGTTSEVHTWLTLLGRTTTPWILGHNPQGLPTLLLQLAVPFGAQALPSMAAVQWSQLWSSVLLGGASLLTPPYRTGPYQVGALLLACALASPLAWRANFVLAAPLVALAFAGALEPSLRRAGLGVLALIAGVGLAVRPEWMGQEKFEAVMRLRPFGLAFLALTAWGLWVARRQGNDAVSPQTGRGPAPQP